MALTPFIAKAATGKVNKTTKVAIEVGGRKVRAEIYGEPTDTDFESKVDAAAKDIEQDLKDRGLIKKPAPAQQPQTPAEKIAVSSGENPILGGTIFDPSRKPQTPAKPAKKRARKEEADQAARDVLKTKSGPEFRQAVKNLGDAINRAALADAVFTNEGDPSLVGDEGIGSVAKPLGSRVRINPQTGQPEKDIFGQPIVEGTSLSQAFKGASRGLGRMVLGGVDVVSPVLQNIPKRDREQAKQAVGAFMLNLAGIDETYSGTTTGIAMGYGLGAASAPIAKAVAKAYQGIKRVVKGIPEGFKSEDWGQQLGRMLATEEGRTALKELAPSAAKEIDEVAVAQQSLGPTKAPVEETLPGISALANTDSQVASTTAATTSKTGARTGQRKPQSTPKFIDETQEKGIVPDTPLTPAEKMELKVLGEILYQRDPVTNKMVYGGTPRQKARAQELYKRLSREIKQAEEEKLRSMLPPDEAEALIEDLKLTGSSKSADITLGEDAWAYRNLLLSEDSNWWDIAVARQGWGRTREFLKEQSRRTDPKLRQKMLDWFFGDDSVVQGRTPKSKPTEKAPLAESNAAPTSDPPMLSEPIKALDAPSSTASKPTLEFVSRRDGNIASSEYELLKVDGDDWSIMKDQSGKYRVAHLRTGSDKTFDSMEEARQWFNENSTSPKIKQIIAQAPVVNDVDAILSSVKQANPDPLPGISALADTTPKATSDVVQSETPKQNLLRQEEPQVKPPKASEGAATPPATSAKGQAEEVAPESTSIKNASVAKDRAEFGLDELPEPAKKAFVDMLDEARTTGKSDYGRVLERARKINSEKKPVPLSDVESAGFTDVLVKLKNEYDATIKKIDSITDKDELAVLYDNIERIKNDFDEITLATKRSGTETARALVARKITLDRDYSLLSLRAEAKAAAAKAGKELSPKQTEEIEAIAKRIEELEKKLSSQESELESLRNLAMNSFSQSVKEARMPKMRSRAEARIATRKQAIDVIKKANEKLAKAQLGKIGSGPDVSAYAEYLREIAPAVTAIVKSYIDEGVEVLDTAVRRVLDDLGKENIKIKEQDVLEIIAGKHTFQNPLPERAKVIMRFRAEAKKIVDADVIKARKKEAEAKRIANQEARRKAMLEARRQLREARQRQAEEVRKWKAEQRRQAQLERDYVRETQKAGRQSKAAADKAYKNWWAENVPTERSEYVNWWNDTAPAETESLMRRIDAQKERQRLSVPPAPKRKPKKEFPENQDLRIELEAEKVKADEYIRELKEELERQKLSPVLRVVMDLLNPRVTKASFDISAPFNQGIVGLITNPKAWANANREMARAVQKDGMKQVVARIRLNPYYKKAMASKLAISETGKIGPNEQRLGRTMFDKVPGFSQSNDAYAAFTQTLRMQMFESMAKKLEQPRLDLMQSIRQGKVVKTKGGALDAKEYEDLAYYINTVTGAGRGQLANALNKIRFFAGGYTVSRFATAFGTPVFRAAIRGNEQLAKAALGEYAKMASVAVGTLGALTAMGFKVDLDARSSTFMQVKIGKNWVDPFGGIFKPLAFIARLGLGSKRERQKGVQEAQPEATLGYFIAGKQEPFSRAVLSAIRGQAHGKNTSVASKEGLINLGIGLYAPIFIEQALEVTKEKNMSDTQKAAMIVSQLFGVQVNRPNKKIDKRKAKPLADVLAPQARAIGRAIKPAVNRLKQVAPK
jgi:hypothetical protein